MQFFRMEEQTSGEPRRLSAWLILGILALPLIFAWFTLRAGYSNAVRSGALLYLMIAILVAVVRDAGS